MEVDKFQGINLLNTINFWTGLEKFYTTEQITEALKAAGFSMVKTDHHKSKPWITVIAKK